MNKRKERMRMDDKMYLTATAQGEVKGTGAGQRRN